MCNFVGCAVWYQGKLLNVREASFKQLKENREIQNILRILGLQINDKVQDTRGLRYGSLMIMTDQVRILLHRVPDETLSLIVSLRVS